MGFVIRIDVILHKNHINVILITSFKHLTAIDLNILLKTNLKSPNQKD